MKKITKLSIITSLLIGGNLFALDITLHKGWNAVGISSKGTYDISKLIDKTKVSSVITYDGNIIENYDPTKPKYSDFTQFVGGKAYWIKSNSDYTFSIGDTPVSLDDLKVEIGWNFIPIPEMNIEDFVNFVKAKGLRVDSVITYDGSIIESYDPSKPKYSDFTASKDGKGYWVKTSKKVATVKTLDGYMIDLYSSRSGKIDSSVIDVIKNSTLDEVFSISDWSNVTSIIINDKKELSTSSLSTIDPDDVKKDLAGVASSVSIYVYGVSEGSAPYALADALIYKVNDDNTTSLIGNTDENGFIYAPSVTKGTKLLIKKDGMDDKIYTIESTGTNYIFMSDSSGLEMPEEKASKTSSRLDYISESLKRKGSVGFYRPASKLGLLRDLPVRRIKPVSVDALDDSASLKALIDSKTKEGYKSDVIASFDFYLKIARRLGGKGYAPFSAFYPDSVEPLITVALPGISYYDVKNAIDGKGATLRLFYFDGKSWKEKVLGKDDVTLTKIKDLTRKKIKASYAREYLADTPLLEIKHTGFYPHVIVLDKKVVFNYPLNITVTDKDGKKVNGAAIFIGGRMLGVTNDKGEFEYNLTAGYESVNFNIKAMKTGYKTDSKVVNIATLKTGATNNINLSLEKVASVASIEGYIKDSNTSKPVYLATVDLYFPYSLAYVKKTSEGIVVGNQPNTRYKWYVKIHDDSSVAGAARVSEKRWLLVKDATSNENGNVLTYQEIKRMIVESKKDDDPADVKSMVSGLFDIALVAEHDIDGDGKVDFVELAATKDKVGTDLLSDVDDSQIDNYAQIIGNIKFNFDVDKFKDNSSVANDLEPSVKVDGVWYSADENYSDYKNYVGLIDEGILDDDYSFGVDINKDWDYFGVQGLGDKVNDHNWTLNFKVGITANINDTTTVVLVKDGDTYKWQLLPDAVAEDYQQYQYIENKNAAFTIATRKFDATEKKFLIYDDPTYKKVSEFVSQNSIMNKLCETLSQIADEVGLDKTAISADDAKKPLIETGFTIVPLAELNTINSKGKEITLIEGDKIENGGIDDITSYILRGKVNINHPVSAPNVLVDKTDRSGKFIFSKLPLEYAKLAGKDISMLTLAAKKYAYYPSPLINVESYEAGETKNINLTLKPKPVASVTVNVIDADTNKTIDANVTIDGQYKEVKSVLDDFKEYSSTESKVGSTVKFDDILSGLRTITISKDGYYPVTLSKPVYADNLNEFNVTLKKASSLDGVTAPVIGIDNYSIEDGAIVLTLVGSDNADGGLTKDGDKFVSELLVFDNGEKIDPVIEMHEDGIIKVTIKTPKIGKNIIIVKLVNPRGEALTSPLNININPTIGSVKGYVTKFTDDNLDSIIDDNHLLIVDFYDGKMNFIQSILANKDGSYINPKLPVGDVYIKARQINATYGTPEKESDLVKIVVAPGIAKEADLELKNIDSFKKWVPKVDFDPSISEEDLTAEAEDNNGTVTLKGKVYHYDGKGKVLVVVNGKNYEVNGDDLTIKDEDNGDFYFNKKVKLVNGDNNIYVKVVNSNGFFDTTPILTVKYGKMVNYVVDFKVLNDENKTISYASLNIVNKESDYYEFVDTNESGESIVELPYYGDTTYQIVATAPGYLSKTMYLTNFNKLDAEDGKVDNHITYTVTLIPETTMSEWYIKDVNYKQDFSFELPVGSVAVDKEVAFEIEPSDEKVHTYNVTIQDEDDNIIASFETSKNEFTYTFDKTGNYTVVITDKEGVITPFTINLSVVSPMDVVPKPPVAPIFPTPTITK